MQTIMWSAVAQLVEHYTGDPSVASSRLTRVSVLCPWQDIIFCCLVLVHLRKTENRPGMAEKLLTGM